MAVLLLVLGIAGAALTLLGFVTTTYPVVAVGVALIFAAFFAFARSQQGTPAPAKSDDSMPPR